MTTFMPEAVPLTRGPAHHWFSYYDKHQFDPSGRYVLGMEVGFEHRSPAATDAIRIGMVDLADGNRWTDLGESRAWCWQQGCMLQWRPGSDREILWNDRENGQFVCRILDVRTGRLRTVPHPVYTVSPDGRTAFGVDFARVNAMYRGYGYEGVSDPCAAEPVPAESGIWRVDLESGRSELLVSIADVVALPYPKPESRTGRHYFNHLLVSPDGRWVEGLDRWTLTSAEGGWEHTRMFVVGADGRGLRVVDDCGLTSHFIWSDADHLLAWSRARSARGDFCRFDVRTGACETVGSSVMTQDGHVNMLPGARWLVNDAYPDRERRRSLYLYDLPSGRRVDLGRFLSPPPYDGEWRCDLHPRLSRDGARVVMDSVHGGEGRQLYLLDVAPLVAGLCA